MGSSQVQGVGWGGAPEEERGAGEVEKKGGREEKIGGDMCRDIEWKSRRRGER